VQTVKRRLVTLAQADDTLQALRSEMPSYSNYIDLAIRRLRMIASRYEQQSADLAELTRSERKPPQRVNLSARRKQLNPAATLLSPPDPRIDNEAYEEDEK